MEATLSRSSLEGIVRAFDPGAGPPGLTGWEALSTPGHTPGHVAFIRREDRVAITGDALVTVDLNSLRGILLGEQRVCRAALVYELELAGGQGLSGRRGEARAERDRQRSRRSNNGARGQGGAARVPCAAQGLSVYEKRPQ